MSRIIKTAKVLRRNWKKSTVFFGVVAYGISYAVEHYRTLQMMRTYCEIAKEHGDRVLPRMAKPKHVTVILNPESNNKKSNITFEKFAAPLLHLAGFKISVFKTESENQAKELMEIMKNTDAVIVAGGNGTLHEAVTGLLNRPQSEGETSDLPIGVIPVGKTNTVAKYLFGSKASTKAQLLAESAMAVIRETTISLDVMRIQHKQDKPVFALLSFETGIFADLNAVVDKYWYLGPLKDKYLYFKNSFKKWAPLENLNLESVPPCSGCSRCYTSPKQPIVKVNDQERWWSAFMPKKTNYKSSEAVVDYSKIVNDACGTRNQLHSSVSNITVSTPAADSHKKEQGGPLWIKIHPDNLSTRQFISSGLNYRESASADSTAACEVVEARQLDIMDTETNQEDEALCEKLCYIDNEKYKMGSYSITLLPKRVLMYG